MKCAAAIAIVLVCGGFAAGAEEIRLVCKNPAREHLVEYTEGASSLIVDPDSRRTELRILVDEKADRRHAVTLEMSPGGPIGRLHPRPYHKLEYWSGGEVCLRPTGATEFDDVEVMMSKGRKGEQARKGRGSRHCRDCRMKRALSRTALVAAALLPLSAQAQATIPGSAMQGSGFLPCERILDWNDRGVDLRFVAHWFLGFWTAENIARVQRGEAPADLNAEAVGPGALEELIVSRCEAEPEARLFNAMRGVQSALPRARPAGE